jgi:hypothetical protein
MLESQDFPSGQKIPSLASSAMSFMSIFFFKRTWYLFSDERITLLGLFLLSCQEGGMIFICSTSSHVKRKEEKYQCYNSIFGFNIIRVRMSNFEGKESNEAELNSCSTCKLTASASLF